MQPSDTPSRGTRGITTAVILIAVVIGVVLRFAELGRMSLWFDEGYTAWVMSLSPGEIIRVIRVDTSPPLYYLVLRGWVGIFGHSEAGMRSLSAVFSSAALMVFYGIARRLLRDRWAVAGAMCLGAVSCMSISYAHEARFYSLTLLLTAINFYLVLLLIEQSTILRLGLLAVGWIISLYTANTLAIYLAAMGLAWLILPGETVVRRRFFDLCIVTAIAAVAFLPWLPTTLGQMRAIHGNFWPSPPDARDLTRTISVLFGINEHAGQRATLILLDAVLAGVFVLCLVQSAIRRTALALTVVVFGPVLLVFEISRISQPIFIERIFLPTVLFAPLLIVLPLTISTIRWRRLCATAVVVLMIFSILSLGPVWLGEYSERWREICQFIDVDRSNRPLIVFAANEGELMYDYYSRNGDYAPSPRLIGLPGGFFGVDPPRTMRRVLSDADLSPLRDALPAHSFYEVILVESHSWWADSSHRIRAFLNQRMWLEEQREFPNTTVYRFTSDR
jgi:uncharacterized membrane protein